MTIWLLLFTCFFCIFIALYASSRQKALKDALQAHGYLLLRSSNSQRRFNYQENAAPRLPWWRRPNVAFREVIFTDRNGAIVQCLAAVVYHGSGTSEAYFDIDLDTLQTRRPATPPPIR
ncbi:MAG TPA: hypothetical protein VGC22_06845 [Chitinophaga sp.]